MSEYLILQIVEALQEEVVLVEQKTPEIHSEGRTLYPVKILLNPETLRSSWAEYLRFEIDTHAANHIAFLNTGHRVLRWNVECLLRHVYDWIRDRVEYRRQMESAKKVESHWPGCRTPYR